MTHIHLDPVGGLAGDMFIAAMLDAVPNLAHGMQDAIERVVKVRCRLLEHSDGTLTGRRFDLEDLTSNGGDHDHDHDHGEEHGDPHVNWTSIRSMLLAAELDEPVKNHAIGIFSALAEAEARVHGVTPDEVTFHEVGSADSIGDIVGAAWLIASVAPASWSIAPIPIGSGRVSTAHGIMPVPAPATALLLEGMATIDDGISGERVTPTGAAIIRYLGTLSSGDRTQAQVLRGSGIGFGTRRLPGISNCLRVLVLDDTAGESGGSTHRRLGVISFEVDDQSAEDLAAGLDRVRASPGVHDIVQMAALGKKGRMAVHVQVLVAPDAMDAVISTCFRETTTIGLRTHVVEARALPREHTEVSVDGRRLRVKVVDRPGGRTGKVESDDLYDVQDWWARLALRRRVDDWLGRLVGETP